jgi:hypothetical protein
VVALAMAEQLLDRMDRSSQRVAAALSQMQERDDLQSRADDSRSSSAPLV